METKEKNFEQNIENRLLTIKGFSLYHEINKEDWEDEQGKWNEREKDIQWFLLNKNI